MIEWILCKDKLPQKEGMYLVSVFDESYDCDIPTGVVIANWAYGQWYKNSIWTIYAWAELPIPAIYDE